jgi:hypothetical protein
MSYIVLQENISLFGYTIVYGIIAITIFTSYKIYKSFKEDLEVQEQNATKIQINELLRRINISEDETEIINLNKKINQLKKELN